MSISENSTFSTVIGVIGVMLVTLLLGSYAYTWNGLEDEQKEKADWRKAHQEELAKKFEEVKLGQKELSALFDKSNTDTKDLLKQILEEQRRANQLSHSQQSHRREP